jgi:DnaJ-class molecular chaperone
MGESEMICQRCHGTGKVKVTPLHSDAIWAMLPCVECNGAGIQSCCEVTAPEPEPPAD